jgi:hypothetical protein
MSENRDEPEPVPAGGYFMEEIGAALPASGPPDPERLADIYRRHNSEIVL